jgi:DNA helicase HerA-like ATPase
MLNSQIPQSGKRNINFPADARIFSVGMTGAGKSYFNWAVLSRARRLIMFDVNGTLFDQTGEWRVVPYQRGIKDLLRGKDARLRVPPLDTEAEYDEIFNFILKNLHHVTLYFDEITGIGKQKGSIPLRRLWQQGRAKHIGIFCSTQRPADVPSVLLSETAYKVMFELQLEQDVERMERLIGPLAERADGSTISIRDLDWQKHDFVVSSPTNRHPQYFAQMRVKHGQPEPNKTDTARPGRRAARRNTG